MKRSLYLTTGCLLFTAGMQSLTGQPGGPLGNQLSGNGGWPGEFLGEIYGTPSTLTIQSDGGRMQGTINADGYIYELRGKVDGSSASGTLSDPTLGGQMDFTANLSGDVISMELLVPGQGGGSGNVQLQFSRAGGTAPGRSSARERSPGEPGPVSGSTGDVQLDQRLVGNWRYTSSYTSGNFSAVSETYMQLHADGTYRYGDSQVMGGGTGTSFDSGRGDVYTGRWKTANKVVYIDEGQGWQPYATYIVDRNSMLFKFDDGSKQLWERYR